MTVDQIIDGLFVMGIYSLGLWLAYACGQWSMIKLMRLLTEKGRFDQ